MKLHAKYPEIDEHGTQDIKYKKNVDQLEKTIFELQLGQEAFINNFQVTLESLVKDTIQKMIAEKGKNLCY